MKAKSSSSVQPKKTRHMSDEAFADLKEALEGALAFERGEQRDLHVIRIRAPRPPKEVSPKDRRKVGARTDGALWRDGVLRRSEM